VGTEFTNLGLMVLNLGLQTRRSLGELSIHRGNRDQVLTLACSSALIRWW